MNEDFAQLLKEYVATYQNPEYKGDWNVVNSKFPEFKNVDKQLLKEYVATYQNPKYGGDWSVVNSKFPEFFGDNVKKKDNSQSDSSDTASPSPLQSQGTTSKNQDGLSLEQRVTGQSAAPASFEDTRQAPVGKTEVQKAATFDFNDTRDYKQRLEDGDLKKDRTVTKSDRLSINSPNLEKSVEAVEFQQSKKELADMAAKTDKGRVFNIATGTDDNGVRNPENRSAFENEALVVEAINKEYESRKIDSTLSDIESKRRRLDEINAKLSSAMEANLTEEEKLAFEDSQANLKYLNEDYQKRMSEIQDEIDLLLHYAKTNTDGSITFNNDKTQEKYKELVRKSNTITSQYQSDFNRITEGASSLVAKAESFNDKYTPLYDEYKSLHKDYISDIEKFNEKNEDLFLELSNYAKASNREGYKSYKSQDLNRRLELMKEVLDAKNMNDGYFALEAFTNPINQEIFSAASFIYKVAALPFLAADAAGMNTGATEALSGIENISDSFAESQMTLKEASGLNPQIGFSKYLANGEFENSFKSLGFSMAEALPSMAAIALSPELVVEKGALKIMSPLARVSQAERLAFVSSKNSMIKETIKSLGTKANLGIVHLADAQASQELETLLDAGVDYPEALIRATLKGLTTYTMEHMFMGGEENIRRAILSEGSEKVKKDITESFWKSLGNFGSEIGEQFVKEGVLEEGVNNLLGQIVDAIADGKPIDYYSFMDESMVGGLMGTSTVLLGTGKRVILNSSAALVTNINLRKNVRDLRKLEASLEKSSLPEYQKSKRIQEMKDAIANEKKKVRGALNNMSDEDYSDYIRSSNMINSLLDEFQSLDSPSQSEVNAYKNKIRDLENYRSEIFSKYSDSTATEAKTPEAKPQEPIVNDELPDEIPSDLADLDFNEDEINSLNELYNQGSVDDVLQSGDKVYMGGKEGHLTTSGDVLQFETSDEIIDLAYTEESKGKDITDLGLSSYPLSKAKATESTKKSSQTTNQSKPQMEVEYDVFELGGKKYQFLRRSKDKKGQSVIKVKDERGLIRTIKGDKAEQILKDLQLKKDTKPQPINLTVEGKEAPVVDKAKQKAEASKNRINAREAKARMVQEAEAKTLKELEAEEARLKADADKFEKEILAQAEKETKHNKSAIVKVGENEFRVTEKKDGGHSVSMRNQKGNFVGIGDAKLREKAVAEFTKVKESKDEQILNDAANLAETYKKENDDKFLAFLDDLIAKTDIKGELHALGLIPAAVNSSLRIFRASYLATKSIAKALDAAYEFIKDKYDVNEIEFKRAMINHIKEKQNGEGTDKSGAVLGKDKGVPTDQGLGDRTTKTGEDVTGNQATDEKVTIAFKEKNIPNVFKENDQVSRMFNEAIGIVNKTIDRRFGTNDTFRSRKSQAIKNAIDYIQKSKAYQDATDIQREQMVVSMKRLLDQNIKTSPTVDQILGNIDEVISMPESKFRNEIRAALSDGANMGAKGQLDFVKWASRAVSMITERGIITTSAAKRVVKELAKVDVKKPSSINSFVEFAAKMFENADYSRRLSESESAKKNIKKRARQKSTPANIAQVSELLASVNLRDLSIDELETFNKLSDGLLASSSKTNKGTKVSTDEVLEFVEKYRKESEKARKENLSKDLEALGIDVDELDLNTLNEIYDAVNQSDEDSNVNEKVKEKKKELNAFRRLVESKLAFLNESKELSKNRNKYIKLLKEVDLSSIDTKTLSEINIVVDNILMNGSFANISGVIGKIETINNIKLMKDKMTKLGIKKLNFVGQISKISSIPMILEKMTLNDFLAGLLYETTGVFDFSSGLAKAKTAMNETVKELNNIVKEARKVAESSKQVSDEMSIKGSVRRAIYSYLSQAPNFEIYEQLKSQILESIDYYKNNTRDAELKEYGIEAEKIFNEEVLGTSFENPFKLKDNTYSSKLINFWVSKFDGNKKQLFENSEDVHNKILVEESTGKYLPLMYIRKNDGKPDELDMLSFDNKNTSKKRSGSTFDRTFAESKDMVLNLDFDRAVYNRFSKDVLDVNTSGTINKINAAFNSSELSGMIDVDTFNMLRGVVKNYVNKSRDYVKMSENEKAFNQMLNMLSRNSGRFALGSLTQVYKQTIPIMMKASVILGSDAGKMFNEALNPIKTKEHRDAMDKLLSNSSVYIRAMKEQDESHIRESVPHAEYNKFSSRISRANKKLGEVLDSVSIDFLSKADKSVAKATFAAFYVKGLKEQGIDTSNIDWVKESQNPNQVALAYADRLVSSTQNVSDIGQQAEALRPDNFIFKAIRNIISPFASFRINAINEELTQIKKLREGGNKKEALVRLTGIALEIATFRSLQVLTQYGYYQLGALALAAMGVDAGDDEFEWAKKFKSAALQGALEFLPYSPFGATGVIDGYLSELVNVGIFNYMMTDEEKAEYLKKSKDISAMKYKKNPLEALQSKNEIDANNANEFALEQYLKYGAPLYSTPENSLGGYDLFFKQSEGTLKAINYAFDPSDIYESKSGKQTKMDLTEDEINALRNLNILYVFGSYGFQDVRKASEVAQRRIYDKKFNEMFEKKTKKSKQSVTFF